MHRFYLYALYFDLIYDIQARTITKKIKVIFFLVEMVILLYNNN